MIVIWAHSECRSNAALFAAVKREAEARGLEVEMCLWDRMPMAGARKLTGLSFTRVGEDLAAGREVLKRHAGPGTVHVFCVYQNSAVWRQLIIEAKAGGARVIVNAEAPCEMCLGVKAWVKRLYYRFILPRRVSSAVQAADLFLSASGKMGLDRLIRLGWRRDQIIPFGYASPRLRGDASVAPIMWTKGKLRVLHLGSEADYRGVWVAERAAKAAGVELKKTGGNLTEEELVAVIRSADIVVGCGLCEPWGMRINDVLLEGVPVVVSDGMGVSQVVEDYGCGCVVPKGDVTALAKVLERCSMDEIFLARLKSGAEVAARELEPETRAKVWLEAVLNG